MSMTTFASPTLTATPVREAAQALVGALQAFAPTVPRSEVHRHVHRAATALQTAVLAGGTLPEILDALVGLTAPAAPEAPPAPPWAPLLDLALDAFAETGGRLRYTPPTVMTRRPAVMTRRLGGHQAM
jgi:hypothetical protein